MTIPTIRADVVLYWLIITVLSTMLIYSRLDVEMIRAEKNKVIEQLAGAPRVEVGE